LTGKGIRNGNRFCLSSGEMARLAPVFLPHPFGGV
jgi:hypothetical protein